MKVVRAPGRLRRPASAQDASHPSPDTGGPISAAQVKLTRWLPGIREPCHWPARFQTFTDPKDEVAARRVT